ncbi:MAG: MFS transporter [Legionellales bacterium]|nr:MFS transporter [Legionellales bacterium]
MLNFRKKLILSGFIGNLLDAYDIAIFGYMTFYIASYFFISSDPLMSLFKTFSIFAISYIVRPIGGIFFGFVADYMGRKKAFVASLLVMGTSTTLIGLLPGYKQLGTLAIGLLLLMRMLQSFGAGGEYTNSIVFLYEHAKASESTFITSFAGLGINTGNLIASSVGGVLAMLMQNHVIGQWGWRIPFLLAGVGMILGLWVRHSLPETLVFITQHREHWSMTLKQFCSKMRLDAKAHRSNYISLVSLIWLGTASTYLLYFYFPLHLSTIRHIVYAKSLTINTCSIALLVMLIPCFGYLSDKWGRKRFIIFATIGYLIFAFPYYLALSYGNLLVIWIVQLGSAVLSAMFYSIAPSIIANSAPPAIRCTMTSLVYGLSSSVFGATAPLIALGLIKLTGFAIAPAFYLMLSAACCLFCLLRVKPSTDEIRVEDLKLQSG